MIPDISVFTARTTHFYIGQLIAHVSGYDTGWAIWEVIGMTTDLIEVSLLDSFSLRHEPSRASAKGSVTMFDIREDDWLTYPSLLYEVSQCL